MVSLLRWPPSPRYSLLPLGGHSDDIDEKDQARQSQVSLLSSTTSLTGRQSQRISIARCLAILIGIILFVVVCLFGSPFTLSTKEAILPPVTSSANVSTAFFDSYMGDVDYFVQTHAASIGDSSSTSFAQMGLLTRLYARLLHDTSANVDVIQSYEKNLWFFAPGISKMRSQQVHCAEQKRGIVVPVGKPSFLFAIHFITAIRSVHKSEMPIEIVYRNEADLPTHLRSYLTTTFTNIHTTGLTTSGVFNDSIADMQGWAIKPFAAVESKFSEVILADADTVFLTPPEDFFEQEDYKRTGTLFFSDRNVPRKNQETKDERIREWLNKQLGENTPSESLANSYFWKSKSIYRQESGIVVLDKRRGYVFASLLFAAWQNVRAIRDKVTYSLFWGDKESFWLAFELARLPYYMNNHGAGSLGSVDHAENNRFCVEHPLHFFEASEGTPRTMEENPPLPAGQRPLLRPAWMNGSMRKNKINKSSKDFIEVKTAMWTMDGTWFWGEKERLNCQRDFTAHSMNEHNLGALMSEMQRTAKMAEWKAQKYIDSFDTVQKTTVKVQERHAAA